MVRLSSSTEFTSFSNCATVTATRNANHFGTVSRRYRSCRAARTHFNSVSWRRTAVNLILLGDGFTKGFRVQRLALFNSGTVYRASPEFHTFSGASDTDGTENRCRPTGPI